MSALLAAVHAVEHFFKGVCICPCKDCTDQNLSRGSRVVCICPPCPADKCGAKKER